MAGETFPGERGICFQKSRGKGGGRLLAKIFPEKGELFQKNSWLEDCWRNTSCREGDLFSKVPAKAGEDYWPKFSRRRGNFFKNFGWRIAGATFPGEGDFSKKSWRRRVETTSQNCPGEGGTFSKREGSVFNEVAAKACEDYWPKFSRRGVTFSEMRGSKKSRRRRVQTTGQNFPGEGRTFLKRGGSVFKELAAKAGEDYWPKFSQRRGNFFQNSWLEDCWQYFSWRGGSVFKAVAAKACEGYWPKFSRRRWNFFKKRGICFQKSSRRRRVKTQALKFSRSRRTWLEDCWRNVSWTGGALFKKIRGEGG